MKNKKLALFGLLYEHSFRKIILVLSLYLIASLGFSFILFKTGYTNNEMQHTANFFNSVYFVVLRKACFFFVIMYSVRGSKLVFVNSNLTKRLNLKARDARLTSLAYTILIYMISFAVIIISIYACIKLELFYFDFAYYNKPYLFLNILSESYMFKNYLNNFIPFYHGIAYLIRFIVVILLNYAVIRGQTKHKVYKQEDVSLAILLSVLFL